MNITVFGGSGFLGSHVCDKLSDAGHSVSIFDLVASKWLRPDQSMFIGNILDLEAMEEAVSGADIVFNFAGIADLEEAMSRPRETVEVNILGNVNILEACRNNNVKRYIFASTIYVYSRHGGFYRCSKQASESYVENYNQQYGLEYTILRYGSLYGLRSDHNNAIYRFIEEALRNNKIKYGGNPESLREYIHVEDAATASVGILDKQYANENITLTGHQSMRVKDLLHMIQEILGKDIELEYSKEKSLAHYDITPYSFVPKVGKKYAAPLHIDMGQGLIQLIEEYSNKSYLKKS